MEQDYYDIGNPSVHRFINYSVLSDYILKSDFSMN
jgi:hypothetical protein